MARFPSADSSARIVIRCGCLLALAMMAGCRGPRRATVAFDRLAPPAAERPISEATEPKPVAQVSHSEPLPAPAPSLPPPRVRDFEALKPRPLLLDDAVRMAIESSPVVRDAGGRVLAMPEAVRGADDAQLLSSDPNLGAQAALSAFDTYFESGLVWNGGGRSVNSAFSTGTFGVFSQPTSLAKVGFGKTFSTGTHVTVGGVGGYDSLLAGGAYAAYAAELRHPLLRGGGREVNRIAGPDAQVGAYRGIWIARIQEDKTRLELEQSIRDLTRDVAVAYWELHFAYENLRAKQAAHEQARSSWQREQQRVAARQAPPDSEALARQQFFSAEAAVQNAIAGTTGSTGVYSMETKLRKLLGLPMCDGRLIRPETPPLEAEFLFDWDDALQLAHHQRVEIRKQLAEIKRRQLELRAARNLSRARVDVIGQYRRLADTPPASSATFSEALQGWQLGVELARPVRNRRENAAVSNAQRRLRRDRTLLAEQQHEISAQLRAAFTELDRAFTVVQTLAASRDAANYRLQAEMQRNAAGETQLEHVLEAQLRATQADTACRRAFVEYNLAFVRLHFVRGTLLQALGVGFATCEQGERLCTQTRRSVFSTGRDVTTVAARPAGE